MCNFVYFQRGNTARCLSLIPVVLLVFTFLHIKRAYAVEAASINSTALAVSGNCVAGDQTGFLIDYTVDPDTNDVINSDTHTLYLLDVNNKVLDSRNLDIFRWNSGPANYSTILFTKKNPTGGPFRVLIHDNASLSADFTNGSTFSAPANKVITEQALVANQFNPACPADNLLAQNNSQEQTQNEETQDSQNIEEQQEELTTNIINQQATSMATGVSNNISSLFTGRGTDPVFNPSNFTSHSSQFSGNFSVQSTGLKRWLAERRHSLQQRKSKDLKEKYGLNQTVMQKQNEPNTEFVDAGEIISADELTGTYNWWAKGSGTYYDGAGYSYNGTQFDIVSGIDYRLNKHLILGLLLGYGRTDFDINNAGVDGKFDADGYSVGPYVGFQIDKYLFAEALLVYTRSDYESASGNLRGDFNADRVTAVVNLRGRYELGGGAVVEPGIGFLYAHEEQEAYRDSGGTTHSSLTVKAGRFSLGPKVTLAPYIYDGTRLNPWFAVKGEYDFSNQKRAAGSTLPDTSDFFSLRTQLGLDTAFNNGSKLTLKTEFSGLLSNKYTGYGGQLRYDMPF